MAAKLNYIAGQWVVASTKETFAVFNPARTNEVLGEVQDSSHEDVTRAVDAAHGAFASWNSMIPAKRGSYLAKAAQILARRRDEAATLLSNEEGKPLFESRGEIDRSVAILEFYANQAALLSGETVPSTIANRFVYTIRAALGPVALITPWNFPCAIPVWKSAPALLCGNTVVLKPAEQAPLSAILLAECFHEAQIPAGVFNLVTGAGEVGEALCSDARIKAISFTGSCAVGKSILAKHAQRLIRIGLEMGGKNPHVVLEDADLDRAVNDVAAGAFFASGHKCTAASRAIVAGSIYDAFVEKLIARAKQVKVGDPLGEGVQVGPVIDGAQMKSILNYIEIGTKEGAKLILGGERLKTPPLDQGNFMGPTIFTDVTPVMRIAREEIFGPVVCVMRAMDFEHAMELANDAEFGLSSAISTTNLARALEFSRRIEAGVVHVNNPTAGLELQLPFGGMKQSSSGYREMGKAAVEFFSTTKTVYIDP